MLDFFGFGLARSTTIEVIKLLRQGRRWQILAVGIGSGLTLLGGLLILLFINGLAPEWISIAGIVIGVSGLLAILTASSIFEAERQLAAAEDLQALSKEAREKPDEPQLAWDLARTKLESYLDRNLRQVSSIFYLVTVMMTIGIILVGIGIWMAIHQTTGLQPAALSALAGVVIQIIGGTLLLVYRSTMSQAKDYVVVLERINAVGMSINVLESVEGDAASKDAAKVEIAKDLLKMYGVSSTKKRAKLKQRQADNSR